MRILTNQFARGEGEIMKKLITLLAVLAVSASANAGLFSKIKKALGETPSWEQIDNNPFLEVFRGHSYSSPEGLDLFNTCVVDEDYFGSIKDVSVCLKEENFFHPDASPVRIGESFFRRCAELGVEPKMVSRTKEVCLRTVARTTQPGDIRHDDGEGSEIVYECAEYGAGESFPLTQKVSVFRKHDISRKIYDSSSDIVQFRKDYTIPHCDELMGGKPAPVPNKKK